MDRYSLNSFIADAAAIAAKRQEPSDTVLHIAPLMFRLLQGPKDFLAAAHYRSDPEHYARNLVFAAAGDCDISLFTLVWEPGQWTPVHDHGSWGVVGVVEGLLREQSYMRLDSDQRADRHNGIKLTRGGLVYLTPGSISTFVPNPDHIHQTGNAAGQPRCVSLHLYGRMMNSFYSYDVAAGTRTLIEAAHNETRLGARQPAA